PDEELDRLADVGVTGLWLIGLWQRSSASAEIKRRRGDQDAVASAYAIDEYRIAEELGGEAAFEQLKGRAWDRGIRLAADMVPNHMGIDSRWVVEHPERFVSVDDSPFPAYTFGGANLSSDSRVELQIEDHYWDGTDAAVVFRRRDTASGEQRFIYHGNDGTSYPWNDTAQVDYLRADVREAVIQTILDVARRAPILRFDAAMVLARKHIRRLWYPEPGAGGAIPSRAEHAVSAATLLATLPGLPMLGHGQVEGFRERYGMEFRRARWDEPVDEGHAGHFVWAIVPLLRRRHEFSGTDLFRLYDAHNDD